ncbi:MAG: DUF1064 domain-containing protein [Bacteroidales bacterium]|nr:DUF1064 domain-containing protein [Bacteroidales bacterium]MCD8394016.1 DUF1064 domain-containing protein [Bacteroidales bacterium]
MNYRRPTQPKGESKYHNRRVTDPSSGEQFDSAREYRRWKLLRAMERAGLISDLQRQVPFELIPALRDAQGRALRATTYVADFTYTDNDTSRLVVEDAKGVRTQVYSLKYKLMLHVHGITIKET